MNGIHHKEKERIKNRADERARQAWLNETPEYRPARYAKRPKSETTLKV